MNGKGRRTFGSLFPIPITQNQEKKQLELAEHSFLNFNEHQQTLEDQCMIEDQCSDLCQKMQTKTDAGITSASKQIQFQINQRYQNGKRKFPKFFNNALQQDEDYISSKKQYQIASNKSTRPNTQIQIFKPNYIQKEEIDQKIIYQKNNQTISKQETEIENIEKLFQSFLEKHETGSPQTRINIQRKNFITYKRHKIQDQYKILQKLGEGAFGSVFKCQHKLSNSIRSVKIIKKKIQHFNRTIKLMKREIEVLKKLDHPSVIKVLEIYQHQKVIYIVSEYCQGGTLKQYLKKRFIFSKDMKKVIMKKILQAVNYIHKMGIIHRDLKPQNILFVNKINSDSTVDSIDIRIIDFGLSIQFRQNPFKDWAKIGSLPFIAPQVFKGVYSTKSDSWSCGVIMHILYMSFNPFFDSEDVSILKKIEDYDLLGNKKFQQLQDEEKAILSRLLDKNYSFAMNLKKYYKKTTSYFQVNNKILQIKQEKQSKG